MSISEEAMQMDRPFEGWTVVRRHSPNRHGVFRDGAGRIALADNSGSVPEATDDGILWLDTAHVIEVGGKTCRLSVRDTSGKEYGTYVAFGEALWFADFFGMVLSAVTSGRRYTVKAVSETMREG